MSMLSVAVNQARAIEAPQAKPVDNLNTQLWAMAARIHKIEQTLAQFIHAPSTLEPNTITKIKRLVCETYGLTGAELISQQRTVRICLPRQIAIYFCLKYTTLTLNSVARHFGNRDHSTLLNARSRITKRRSRDEAFDGELTGLEAQLGPRA